MSGCSYPSIITWVVLAGFGTPSVNLLPLGQLVTTLYTVVESPVFLDVYLKYKHKMQIFLKKSSYYVFEMDSLRLFSHSIKI